MCEGGVTVCAGGLGLVSQVFIDEWLWGIVTSLSLLGQWRHTSTGQMDKLLLVNKSLLFTFTLLLIYSSLNKQDTSC